MRKILKDILLFTIIIIYFIYTIKYSGYIKNQTIYSIYIWITKIIPSLFPTLIIIDLIYSTNLPLYLNKYFHINIIYFLSIISGSPSNAKMAINYQDIEKTLATTKYISLIFLYNSLIINYNKKITFILIISNIFSNIILKFIIKPQDKENIKLNNENIIKNIKTYMLTLISILGTIILINTLPLFIIKNKYLELLILSITEITTYFNTLSLSILPLYYKIITSIIAISTCGICIELQIKSIINDTSINYKLYIKYRLIHLFIYSITSITLISIFN